MLKLVMDRFNKKNIFSQNIILLVGSTAVAQLVVILATPVLTRLYTPEQYGLLAIFTSITMIISIVGSGRLELAISLPKSDDEAKCILLLGLIFTVITVLIVSAIILFLPSSVYETANYKFNENYIWLVPISVLFICSYQIFSSYSAREKQYKSIAKSLYYQSFVTVFMQLIGGVFGFVFFLIAGKVLGNSVALFTVVNRIKKEAYANIYSYKLIFDTLCKYREFPTISTATSFLNVASLNMTPIILLALFGSPIAGLYALTHRILTLPSSLIGNAVSKVFLAEAPSAHRQGKLEELVDKIYRKLLYFATPIALIIVSYGDVLFSFVFGAEWKTAGVYAQWMAPWLYLHFLWHPLSTISVILKLQKELLIINIISFFLRIVAIYLAYTVFMDSELVIAVFSVTSTIIYAARSYWFYSKSNCSMLYIYASFSFAALLYIMQFKSFV